jgi:hypothetical protein
MHPMAICLADRYRVRFCLPVASVCPSQNATEAISEEPDLHPLFLGNAPFFAGGPGNNRDVDICL